MKKHFNYTLLVAFLLTIAGCGDFGDLNISPNSSETPLTSALLTNSITGFASAVSTAKPSLFCQYRSQTQYTDASRYQFDPTEWEGEYVGSIYDLQNIININTDEATAAIAALNGANANQIAIARILKAYRFSVMTDRYGDIPYSEALTTNIIPVFDPQESIYMDLFNELDGAVKQFEEGGIPVKGDILLNGDLTWWKKFANSWRLILALRISNVDETTGAAQANAAISAAGGLISDNAENVMLTYPGGAFNSPWYSVGGDYGVSSSVADMLNDLNDERLNAYGTPHNGELIGVPYGLQRQDAINWTTANPDWSLVLANPFREQEGSIYLVTFADVALALAEASQRGWITLTGDIASTFGSTTEAVYNKGIEASWKQWEVFEQAAFDNYITQTSITLTDGDPFEKIGNQRWLAFFPNGFQGWSEWRRTGFPVLAPAPEPLNNSKKIPVRYVYPTSEYNRNGLNLQNAIDLLGGGDTDASPVWWDVD